MLLEAVEHADQRRLVDADDPAQLELGALLTVVERGEHEPVADVVEAHLDGGPVEIDGHAVGRGVQQERQVGRPEQPEQDAGCAELGVVRLARSHDPQGTG